MCNKNEDNEEKQEIRAAYKLAIDLWTYTDQHFWSMFNAMLLANSILITPIGWLFATDHPSDQYQSLLSFLCFYVIPLLGIILCFIWFIMTHRAACYRRYYIFTARQLEEKNHLINILSRGGEIQSSKPIEFFFKNGDNKTIKKIIKLPYIGKFYDTWSCYVIIGLFTIVHFIMLLKNHYKEIAQFIGILD